MIIKISDRVQLEVTDNNECTLTWCDFQKEIVGSLDIDGSDHVVMSKCYKDGHTKTIILDMIEPNVMIRPFPLECDEVGNVK